jgi:hypothetical protein
MSKSDSRKINRTETNVKFQHFIWTYPKVTNGKYLAVKMSAPPSI